MKLTTSLGRQVARPAVTGIVEAAKDTQRAVRELGAQAGELSGAVIRRGGALIRDGGGLVIRSIPYNPFNGDTGEFDQYRWGALPDDPLYNRPDGLLQQAFVAYRDDKTIALSIAELRADLPPYAQAWALWDRSGNIIVAEDTNSGQGLARPHLGQFAGNGDTNIATWPATTNTSWTAIWSQYWEIQNPNLSWNSQLYVPAGLTGQWRLSYGGTVIGTSSVISGGGSGLFSQWFGSRVLLPGDIGDENLLTVEAIITAGTGTVYFNWVQLKGDQS